MRLSRLIFCSALLLACGGGPSTAADSPAKSKSNNSTSEEFQTHTSTTAGSAHGVTQSKIKATEAEAAMKLFVIDKATNEPVPGMVISLQAPDGKKYYTGETDALGYGEVLVPVGQTYELLYLSLGEKDITANVKVSAEPRQNIKLTLRFKRRDVLPAPVVRPPKNSEAPVQVERTQPTFRLEGVNFNSASADILPESYSRLDDIVEYMTYKISSRIEIAGHTDNVGPATKNKALSKKRAEVCRRYLIKKGIDGSRIKAVGYGDEMPVAPNDSEEGRQKNRRIEAREI